MDIKQATQMMKDYMTTPALAGYEKRMAILFREKITPYCDDVRIDKLGNVIGTIKGTDPEAPKIMLYAHMDNIGFFVKHIDKNGFLLLERNSPQEKVIPGVTLLVETENGDYVNGTFCIKPYYLMTDEDKTKVTPLSSLYVDIGCDSDDEVRALGVEIGCPVMYTPSFKHLYGTKITGTFVDNRGGCGGVTIAAEILSKKRPKSTVYIVGTVWEEFNLRGAAMANRTAKCDIAIGLDGPGGVFDPSHKGSDNTKDGVGVSLFNFHGRGTLNGCIPQKALLELIKEVSADLGYPLSRKAGRGGLSDTSYIQLENDGVACIDVSVMGRYSHSYHELLDIAGLLKTGEVVAEMILRIDKDFTLSRY